MSANGHLLLIICLNNISQEEIRQLSSLPITVLSLAKDINGHLKPYTTSWDAIGETTQTNQNKDLRARGKWADLLPSIPEGENYLWHTNRKGGLNLFGWRTRYWTFLLKLAKNQPSWTIQAQPGPSTGPFHWENRLLSIDELARLQTFPNDIIFNGSRISVVRQIGNAVPSLLSEILARSIGEQFFGMAYSGEPKYTVQYRRPIPPAEPVQKVQEKYYSMIGDHAEHPGPTKKTTFFVRLAPIYLLVLAPIGHSFFV